MTRLVERKEEILKRLSKSLDYMQNCVIKILRVWQSLYRTINIIQLIREYDYS